MGVKVNPKTKPVTKNGMGRSPATREEMVIAAKPKCDVVKAMPLKLMKELIEKK